MSLRRGARSAHDGYLSGSFPGRRTTGLVLVSRDGYSALCYSSVWLVEYCVWRSAVGGRDFVGRGAALSHVCSCVFVSVVGWC